MLFPSSIEGRKTLGDIFHSSSSSYLKHDNVLLIPGVVYLPRPDSKGARVVVPEQWFDVEGLPGHQGSSAAGRHQQDCCVHQQGMDGQAQRGVPCLLLSLPGSPIRAQPLWSGPVS